MNLKDTDKRYAIPLHMHILRDLYICEIMKCMHPLSLLCNKKRVQQYCSL